MWRFALSRRWWAGHVLVAALSVAFLGLARWQWDRAHSAGGDWQNFGYALQWPVFAIFLVAGWLRFLWLERFLRLEQHRPEQHRPEHNQGRDGVIEGERPVSAPPQPPAARGRASRPIPEDEPDDELAAYNAYLAQLAEQDRHR